MPEHNAAYAIRSRAAGAVVRGSAAPPRAASSTQGSRPSRTQASPERASASVNGFDPVPNVRLSIARFRYFLTPYRDRYEPHGWRNRYVIVIP